MAFNAEKPMKEENRKPNYSPIPAFLSCMLWLVLSYIFAYNTLAQSNVSGVQPAPALTDKDWEHELTVASGFLSSHGIDTHGLRLTLSSGNLVCFSNEQNKSFCIVACKDYESYLDSPILAYSPDSPLLTGNDSEISSTLTSILSTYSRQLRELSEKPDLSLHPDSMRPSYSGNVEPMLGNMAYGQRSPYNNLFPLESAEGSIRRCVAGCGPVALAQILSYYRYPDVPASQGVITTASGQQKIIDIGSKKLEWNGTGSDLATLMLGCAASLHAQTGSSVTTSSIDNFKAALIDNWGYSPRCITLSGVSDIKLLDAVYSELDAGRPVIAASENHIFVCDGYEQDYLHINWGWNGYCNGYFKTVTTSSASRGQLPFQYILIGITPLFDSLQATIRVDQPGSLSRMIDRAVLDRITSLTVYGTLNGSDIKCLRRMAGASDPLGEQEDIGSLMNLDLSGVRIITGMPYATYHADGYIISGRATDRDSGEYRYRYNLSEVTDSIWKEIVDHRLDNRGDMLLRRDSKGQIYISYYALDNVIGKRMFSDCQSLKNIILPDVTQSVDEDAFSGCRSLETVRNLPQTVHRNAFSNCINLKW